MHDLDVFKFPLKSDIPDEYINSDDVIKLNKLLSKYSKTIKNYSPSSCPICNQPIQSYCNSHSIPRFCLKQIAENGMIISPGIIFGFPIKFQTGIANTGTFRLICERCDHEAFSEYEQPQNYNIEPSSKMLAQIAMKSSLRSQYKRITEINLYQQIENDYVLQNYDGPNLENIKDISLRDLSDFKKDFLFAKKALENNINPQYHLGYYKKLNYTIPTATQVEVALVTDLRGNIINNIYNGSTSYNLQLLHICLFPLENSSIVLLFFKSGHNKLRKFCRDLKSLNEDEQLRLISYISFLYSEDVYINKDIKELLEKYDSAKNAITTTSFITGFSDNPQRISPYEEINAIKDNFDLNQYKTFPNLLSEEFKIFKELI